MNDSMQTSLAAGDAALPVIRFNPVGDPLPPTLADTGGPGALILLVDATADRAWAAETVVALAAAWAAEGRRVVLADLHLEDPVLHERLDEDNLDGIVDIFLYGASLARSARQVAGRGFYLIPAGTYASDAAAVYRHPRWEKLVAGFRDADAMLLLFVPGGAVDAAALGEWAREAIVLGAESAALTASLRAAGVPLRAMLVPPQAPAAADDDPDRTLEIGIPVPLPAAVLGTVATRAAAPPAELADRTHPPDIAAEPAEPVGIPSDAAAADASEWTLVPVDAIDRVDPGEPMEAEAPLEPLEPLELDAAELVDVAAPHEPEPWADLAGALTPEPWELPDAELGRAEREAAVGIAAAEASAAPTQAVRAEAASPALDPVDVIPEGVVVRRRRRRRGSLLLLWAGLGVVALAIAAYLLATSRPDWLRRTGGDRITPTDSLVGVGAAAVGAAAAPEPTAPTPAGEALPYAVQVKAFTTLAAAQKQIDADQRRAAGTLFYISPEREQGILYYKVRAGLLADTVEATTLRQALVDAGVIDRQDAAGAWSLIQYAPFAFELGDFADAASAGAHADSLAAAGVPTYAVEVPFSDGSSQWRLYAGAYRDSTRAEALGELFERARVAMPPLVERVGKGAGQGG